MFTHSLCTYNSQYVLWLEKYYAFDIVGRAINDYNNVQSTITQLNQLHYKNLILYNCKYTVHVIGLSIADDAAEWSVIIILEVISG